MVQPGDTESKSEPGEEHGALFDLHHDHSEQWAGRAADQDTFVRAHSLILKRINHLKPEISNTHLSSALLWLFPSMAAGQSDNQSATVCSFALGDTKPGGAFAFAAWYEQGRCVRAISDYAQCRVRLDSVLSNNVDALHSAKYSAAATVLTLLPTTGAVFGSPTSETWTLFKICPPVGVLALSLSFGGSLLPASLSDYMSTWTKQGVSGFWMEGAVNKGKDAQTTHEPKNPIHEKIRAALQSGGKVGSIPLRPNTVLYLGIAGLLGLLGAVMASMAILEQGAVYSTWCTSTWWMHVWYLVVTATSMLDSWIQRPFEERWSVYVSEWPDTGSIRDDGGQVELQQLLVNRGQSHIKSASETNRTVRVGLGHEFSARASAEVLVVISVSREDKRLPFWITALRLLSRAVGIIIYVFATSVFAAVTLLALPMAQMMLVLVMGAGLFGRAIVSGVVTVITQKRPILHILTDTNVKADELLKNIMSCRQANTNKPLRFDISGAIYEGDRCVARRSKWSRSLLGMFGAGIGSSTNSLLQNQGAWSGSVLETNARINTMG